MKNRIDLIGLYYACFRIGAIAVPLNTRYRTPEAIYGLEQSGSKLLITSAERFPVVENLDSALPLLERIYLIDGKPEHSSLSWGKATADAAETVSFPDVRGSDPAVIIYTSGSTAKPKGVIHTHDTLYHHIMNKTIYHESGPDDRVLVPTQISHAAGFAEAMLPFLGNGATVLMMEEFEPGGYLRFLKRYKPTLAMFLPTQLLEVVDICRQPSQKSHRQNRSEKTPQPGRSSDLFITPGNRYIQPVPYAITPDQPFLASALALR